MTDIYKIILLRHGESLWNQENRFTGWKDIDLSPVGVQEALAAASILKQNNISFNMAFTSVLKRAIRTLGIVMEEMDRLWVPVEKSWRLNERHYGSLQGLNKKEMAAQYGEEQIHQWRRGYYTLPPLLEPNDPQHARWEERYSELRPDEVPSGESLDLTVKRVVPYWRDKIVPEIILGKRVLISAHGNSLRALVKYLDQMNEEEIVGINIPTGIPLLYELDQDLKPIRHYYLGDAETLKSKIAAVAHQGKKS